MPKNKLLLRADEPGADLWGRRPAWPCTCPGCGQKAEPFEGRFCWLCCHTGQRERVLNGPTVTADDRRRMARAPRVMS